MKIIITIAIRVSSFEIDQDSSCYVHHVMSYDSISSQSVTSIIATWTEHFLTSHELATLLYKKRSTIGLKRQAKDALTLGTGYL